MACLHLVNSERALAACMTVAVEQDAILLLGPVAARLTVEDVDRPLLVLADDLPPGTSLEAGVQSIDYATFVSLAAAHQPIITW